MKTGPPAARAQSNRHPPPPFITSTLQQEASNVLGFGATQTMSIAQRLYEGVDGSEGEGPPHRLKACAWHGRSSPSNSAPTIKFCCPYP